jgi:hypothetical protein
VAVMGGVQTKSRERGSRDQTERNMANGAGSVGAGPAV